MATKNLSVLAAMIAALTVIGCSVEEKPADVVTPPSSTTVIKEKGDTPTPNVNITTPAPSATHTETNSTTTVPSDGSPSTTTTTKSTTTTG